MLTAAERQVDRSHVSVLYREPMWLKSAFELSLSSSSEVSVLYREPMWLKSLPATRFDLERVGFSALP